MRRVATLLFFISFFVVEAHAQRTIHHRKKLYVGGLQGVTTSQISGDGHRGFHKYGMMGGLFVTREISQSLNLQIEAIYKEKGSSYHARPVSDTAAVHSPYYEAPTKGYLLKLNYIEFPVLLQYTFSELSRLDGLIVEVGPGFGIPVHIEEYVTVPGFNQRQYGPTFNYYEISYNVGLSYYLESNIGFNLRFSRSANAVRDYYKGEKTTTLSPGQQNTVLSFSVSYRLRL